MEYKFKTVYHGKLVKCGINPINNEIYLHRTDIGDFGLVFEDCGKEFLELQLSKFDIFQYTGKKDINGEEIYNGHILLINDDYFKVYWNDHEAAFMFSLVPSFTDSFPMSDKRIKKSKISSHEAIK